MNPHLHGLDITIIFLYAALLIAMGLFTGGATKPRGNS